MQDLLPLRSFSNIGHMAHGRYFAGFPQRTTVSHRIDPRGSLLVKAVKGDLIRISLEGPGAEIAILAFDPSGARREADLGISPPKALSAGDFAAAPLTGWLGAHGVTGELSLEASAVSYQADGVVLRVPSALTLWIVNPAAPVDLVNGTGRGVARVEHTKQAGQLDLPEPLGDVRDEFTVARGTAQAYQLQRGEVLQIIDVEGQQCSDFQAFGLAALDRAQERMIDGTATRSMVRRSFPGPGLFDKFFDAEMTPMLRVLRDTCGRHDTFGLACTARGYEERGFPGHVNCSDNISRAVAPFGVAPRTAWPAINFFWNTWIDAHHHLQTEESYSRPGDYVAMEALDDLTCVSTACPDDIDPINGWNPTDVHVRIYRPETRITRSVAYRSKEDAPMQISQESAFHERLAPLTDHFAPARDLWLPVSFPSHGTLGEYWACREAATLQDMSGLRKYDVMGPDAERLLQRALTRDIARLAVWRGSYAVMCDDTGQVIDDGTLFRLAPHLFRWCCGSEESGRALTALAEREGLQVRIHDLGGALPNLALQGPKSREILRKLVFTQPHVPNLDQLNWFGATVARVAHREGAPFFLTRSGYTGELGYELFCSKEDAVELWDSVMEAGAEFGLKPMGSAALNIIRIEAGLAAAGAEFTAGVDAFEAGLGFAVNLKKSDFVGKPALERNATAQRHQLKGLLFDCTDVPPHGAPVFCTERQIGTVTSATHSPMLERSIAMARLNIEHAGNGTAVQVGQMDGRMKRLSATVTDIPFVDPKRERARA
ncbi:DUF1989 domain-containing protein [Roseobacter sinensis]|uniref:Aminomethyltransferase family protein n=1 Tax=Roseobacter sinensis TaxID=2931391 RepID=A0ABT3BF05_9RHOB|nr:aminomethyltransferase family protein [Roseobacter sp. WL0113]MCV3272161.1 aminomethyltransferase family protein [Roseobacter sp. WL0113]